jgi:hypothetical protein
MALDITINLNDELEAELVKLTRESNEANPGGNPLTPSQFFRRDAKDRLQLSAQQRADAERIRFRAIYNAASVEDKAIMDALAVKYSGVQR